MPIAGQCPESAKDGENAGEIGVNSRAAGHLMNRMQQWADAEYCHFMAAIPMAHGTDVGS